MLKSTDITNAGFAITKFREGYEQGDVDELLERARAALAAWETHGTATLTARDVNALHFRPTKFGNGYDQDQVDDFLDQVVASLTEHENAVPVATQAPAGSVPLLRSSAVLDRQFTSTWFREGYSAAGVDGFLAAARGVIAAYEREGAATGPADLTADDVLNVRFTPARFKKGYDQGQVDDYLDEIVVTIRHYERAAEQR